MHQLKVGDKFISEVLVKEDNTAAAFGSGDILVFSTPNMVGLMENAALKCADLGLEAGFSTVGTFVDIVHSAATPIGMIVKAEAELIAIEGKKLTFNVVAFDEKEEIGRGTHGRYIIESKKFLERVNAKVIK